MVHKELGNLQINWEFRGKLVLVIEELGIFEFLATLQVVVCC